MSQEQYGMFQLSELESLERHDVDLVAVHGLGGHWKRTWTAKNGRFWLAEFLPVQYPTARVMSYGWNSAVFGKALTNLRDEAEMLLQYLGDKRDVSSRKKPLLFICHSLGGLLVKQALVIAHERSAAYGALLASTTAILFFAVPNDGSWLGKPAYLAAGFLSLLGFRINRRHLKLLAQGSDELIALAHQFKERARNLDLTIFFETSKLVRWEVVSKASSGAGLSDKDIIGIPDSNHRTICTYSSLDCQRYHLVSGAINRAIKRYVCQAPGEGGDVEVPDSQSTEMSASHAMDTTLEALPTASDDVYNPIKYPSPHFTGREDHLAQLAAFFAPREPSMPPTRREFVLYGIGGAGKTQISLKFCELHSHLFWKIFWVDATNRETLELGYRAISADPAAKRGGVDGSIKSVVQWLSYAPKEWLIILDNLDWEASQILDSCVPRGRRGNLLITTRNPNLARQSPTHASSEVGDLARTDAKRMLAKAIGLDGTRLSLDEDTWIGRIVDEVHLHALVIDMAGAAISSDLCRLEGFVKDLRDHRPQLLSHPDLHGESGYNQSLYSTLSLTTNNLLKATIRNAGGTSPSPEAMALELLNMFAFLHNNSIMEDLFRRAAERNHKQLTAQGMADPGTQLPPASTFLPHYLLKTDQDGKWDYFMFRQSVRLLRASSMVRLDAGRDSYSIHPHVHQWSRDRLDITERRQAIRHVRATLASAIEVVDHYHKDPAFSRELVPHLVAYLNAAGQLSPGVEFYEESAESFGQIFMEAGRWAEADENFRNLGNYRADAHGETDERTLRAKEKLVIVLRSGGKENALSEALSIQDFVLHEREKILGAYHATTLRSKIELGAVHFHCGDYVQAEALYSSAHELSVQHLDSTHPVSLEASELLSAVYRERHSFERAESIQREDMEIKRRLFGDTDLRTVVSTSNLAATLTSMGKLGESETLKIQVAKVRAKLLGEAHHDTLMAYSNLAVTYARQGKWNEAEEVILDVISKQNAAPGELSRETLRARQILANVYRGQGRFVEAESLCRKVVAGREAVLGKTHSDTLWSMHFLATNLEKLDRTLDAIDVWTEATTLMKQEDSSRAGSRWETQEAMRHLGETLWKVGRINDARGIIKEVIKLKRAAVISDDQSVMELTELLESWALAEETTAST